MQGLEANKIYVLFMTLYSKRGDLEFFLDEEEVIALTFRTEEEKKSWLDLAKVFWGLLLII